MILHDESSNGMLDELASPEDFKFLKDIEDEDGSPLSNFVQNDALEFTIKELAKMNAKGEWKFIILLKFQL